MKPGPAFLAGVVGGAVMSALMFVARMLGLEVQIELILGTLIGLAPGPTAWIVGFAIHLVASGLIALGYAWGFERVFHRAGWRAGLLAALVHDLIAGVVLGVMPALHPLMPEAVAAPGFFMLNLGVMGLVALLAVHLVYGAIVGAMYGPVRHPRGDAARAV